MAAEALALEPLAWEEEEDEGQRPALALVPERLVAEGSSAAVVLAHIEQEHLRGRLPVNRQPVSPGYREDGMRRVWIYGLVDPRDDRIRYAGKSHQPRARLRRYGRCEKQGELHPWLLELRAAGLEPQMYLLEETDEENFKECEKVWVARCRAVDLEGNLNVSDGGERGGSTLIWTDAAIWMAIQEWMTEHNGVFPSQRGLIKAGRSDLDNAILKKGYGYWQEVFGVEPPRKSWPEDAIRMAIEEWMTEHNGVFPTQQALLKAGRSDLNNAITKSGGYLHWRRVFGVEFLQENWQDETVIREAIQAWRNEHEGEFPTGQALRQAGYSGLDYAIQKSGGRAYWQPEFGVKPRRNWSDTMIREAIQTWRSEHNGEFPTRTALMKEGREDLNCAIKKSGYRRWQLEFGAEPPPWKSWPDEAIRTAIREWMEGHGADFPTRTALLKAGRSDLDSAIRKKGYRHWQDEFGVESRQKSWSEEAIRIDIQAWMKERNSVFPTHRTLVKGGRSDLAGAIQRSGGFRHWQRVFGVEAPKKSWPEDAIGNEITGWMAEHNGVFPTHGELIKAGRSDLDHAITKSGGYPHWQEVFRRGASSEELAG